MSPASHKLTMRDLSVECHVTTVTKEQMGALFLYHFASDRTETTPPTLFTFYCGNNVYTVPREWFL